MTLSAGANITGLNHTLQQLIANYHSTSLEIPGKVPKTENFNCLHYNYWLQKITKTLIYHVYSTHKQRILYWPGVG